ncbi:MAG: hypothetical protein Phyf2KO_00280 [Phycisphaerales bacterium]
MFFALSVLYTSSFVVASSHYTDTNSLVELSEGVGYSSLCARITGGGATQWDMSAGTAFDAVCGIESNVDRTSEAGSGFYIGEDLNGDHWVLTAAHVITHFPQFVSNPSHYSVHFIRHPDGSVGTNQSSDWSSMYEVKIDSYILISTASPIGDAALLKLDLDNDPAALDHIEPMNVWTSVPPRNEELLHPSELGYFGPDSRVELMVAGWGKGPEGDHRLRYGSTLFASRFSAVTGTLQYAKDPDINQIDPAIDISLIVQDSGSPMMMQNELGEYGAIALVTSSANGGSGDLLASTRRLDLFPFIISNDQDVWELDVTGHAGSATSGLEWVTSPLATDPLRPDGSLDMNDAVMARARTYAGDPRFDFDGDTVTNASDWTEYVNQVSTQSNKYGYWDTLPLRADVIDLSGDGRLDDVDAVALRDHIDFGTTSLFMDYDQNGIVEEADAVILDDVTAAFGHLAFDRLGDLNADTVADSADMILLRAHAPTSGGAFHGQAAGEADYLERLDFDNDRDNDLKDALAFKSSVYPGEVGSWGTTSSYTSSQFPFNPDWVMDTDDIRFVLFNVNSSGGPRAIQMRDISGSIDPASSLYAKPDGVIDLRDVNRFMQLGASPITGEAPIDDMIYHAVFDANEDGRFNWHDAVEYEFREGTTDTAFIQGYDINGDGAITSYEKGNIVAILANTSSEWTEAPPIGGGAPAKMLYNQGVAGDYDNDCDPSRGPNTCCLNFGTYNCEICSTYTLASIPADLKADCDDKSTLHAAIQSGAFAFDGRRFGASEGYLFRMDVDLDGDNDSRDRMRVLQLIEPADSDGNGVLDGKDMGAFIKAYQFGDLMADANLNGVLDDQVTEYNAWMMAFMNPNCP